MDKQAQDNRWNDLSEEEQKAALNMYKQLNNPINPAKSNTQTEQKVMRTAMENAYGSHNLNPKPLTYVDIVKEMFPEGRLGTISVTLPTFSDEQAEKLKAIWRLITTAKYLNGDWKPDWENEKENKYYVMISSLAVDNRISICSTIHNNSSIVYFRTEELAEQAVEILGEETVRLALTTDY